MDGDGEAVTVGAAVATALGGSDCFFSSGVFGDLATWLVVASVAVVATLVGAMDSTFGAGAGEAIFAPGGNSKKNGFSSLFFSGSFALGAVAT